MVLGSVETGKTVSTFQADHYATGYQRGNPECMALHGLPIYLNLQPFPGFGCYKDSNGL